MSPNPTPTDEQYQRASAAILHALGAKEDFPHQADFLAHRALDAALLSPDEKFARDMDAIREMERHDLYAGDVL